MEEVLIKYFKDESIIYYSAPDRIQQDNYIRKTLGGGNTIIISVGNNDGEVDVGCFRFNDEDFEELIDNLIQTLIHNGRIFKKVR